MCGQVSKRYKKKNIWIKCIVMKSWMSTKVPRSNSVIYYSAEYLEKKIAKIWLNREQNIQGE